MNRPVLGSLLEVTLWIYGYMDILSLSISVVNAHNTNNADLFAIACSQLEDAVMGHKTKR